MSIAKPQVATPARRSKIIVSSLAYLAMVLGAIWIFGLIRTQGAAMEFAGARHVLSSDGGSAHGSSLAQLLLLLSVVVLAARCCGRVFERLGQPPVVGEMIAGIALGPSLLGRVSPDAMAWIAPSSVTPALAAVSQLGVIGYMFLVGMELDTSLLRRKSHATLAISHASIVVPFVLGALLSLWIYPRAGDRHVSFELFAMFIGISMSVTAFPVLARILTDRSLQRTRLGVIALSCAAIDDVTAWCLLAVILGLARAQLGNAAVTAALTMSYVAAMALIVKPWLARVAERYESTSEPPRGATVFLLVGLLLSSLTSEAIGVHAIFGAFLFGACIPHDSRIASHLRGRLEDFVTVVLLPAFFAATGLRTQLGLLQADSDWLLCAAIIAVACIGKFGGSTIAARWTGSSWSESASIGVLMNTRGLMELVVLNIGLDMKVITPAVFAMLVLMAVVTTIATTPALWLIRRAIREPSVPDEAASTAAAT